MRVASLQIGSLFWEQHRWRTGVLDFDRARPVDVPIRYARKSLSRDNGYTMVLCSSLTPLGGAYLVPFCREVVTFDDLVSLAEEMAYAEGFSQSLATTWGALALSGADEKFRALWAGKLNLGAAAVVARFPEGASPMADTGLVSTVLDAGEGIGAVLAAVTSPTGAFPTVEQIIGGMGEPNRPNKGHQYFRRNRQSGIRTFQDEEIEKTLLAKGYAT